VGRVLFLIFNNDLADSGKSSLSICWWLHPLPWHQSSFRKAGCSICPLFRPWKKITSWPKTWNMSFNPDKSHPLISFLSEIIVWQTTPLVPPPPANLLSKQSSSGSSFNQAPGLHYQQWYFLGKPHFKVGLRSHSPNDHTPSYKVLPWHTWTQIHLQGLHVQLGGGLLSLLWAGSRLTSHPDWCCTNQGLQDHWNFPHWSWVEDEPMAVTSPLQTGQWFLWLWPPHFQDCTFWSFCALSPPGFCRAHRVHHQPPSCETTEIQVTAHLQSFVPLFSCLKNQLPCPVQSHSSLQVFKTAVRHHLRSPPFEQHDLFCPC